MESPERNLPPETAMHFQAIQELPNDVLWSRMTGADFPVPVRSEALAELVVRGDDRVPSYILDTLRGAHPDPDNPWWIEMIYATEDASFPREQREELRKILQSVVLYFKGSPLANTLPILHAALRRLSTVLPAVDVVVYLQFLRNDNPLSTRIVALQGIQNVLFSEPPGQHGIDPALWHRVAVIADAFLHPDVVSGGDVGAMAINAIAAIAALGDQRLPMFVTKAVQTEKRWFLRQLHAQLEESLDRWGVVTISEETPALARLRSAVEVLRTYA